MKFELDDWLLILGGALIVIGVALIYFPAGLIVAGCELVGLAYLFRAEKTHAITK